MSTLDFKSHKALSYFFPLDFSAIAQRPKHMLTHVLLIALRVSSITTVWPELEVYSVL